MKMSKPFVKVPLDCITNLTAIQLQLWAHIASHADSFTVHCRHLQKTFKKDRSTLIKHLKDMEEKGYIEKNKVPYKRTFRNAYKAIIPEA